jgi:hypothetical protein
MSDRLLDSISRILASPMPRRQAVKMIAGGFGAAAAALLGGREAWASCKKGEKICGDVCCKKNQRCVTKDGRKRCVSDVNNFFPAAAGAGIAAEGVYGGIKASSDGCKKNETHCGGTCCPHGHVCTSPGVCCPPGHVCGSFCCPTGQSCVTENGQLHCRSTNPSASM